MKQKTIAAIATELPEGAALVPAVEDKTGFECLAASLAEIRKLEGINGYILRSSNSAVIDLTEQDKIINYAILSTQICESGQEMANQFSLANIESVLVEGKNTKVLCTTIGENRIAIFMEKATSDDGIIERIRK